MRLSRSGSEALAREAARLRRRARFYSHTPRAAALPALFFVTDPDRVRDPVAVAARLPRGAGVIYRGFGREEAPETARALACVCRERGLMLLVGADPALAAAVGAHGLHLPERLLHLAPRLRRARPQWRLTGAAHSAAALRRAWLMGLDAALASTVFPSASASAQGTRTLGPLRFAALVREARLPVYALGGIDARSAARLGSGWGLAAVEALAEGG